MQNALNCIRPAWWRHRYITKTMLVMKLTVLFLTVGFLNVSATGVSQNVSFSGQNVPLESVFSSVKKQTGFVFLYSKAVLKSSKPVSIDVRNIELKDFLSEIFKSQPLEYLIEGKSILVSPKSTSPQPSRGTSDHLQDTSIDVRGRVVDENGEPLVGVNVIVKGTTKGTATDSKGEFILRNVDENAVLSISSVGYQTTGVNIKGKGSIININLSKVVSSLDEVQVIAYGTTTRKLATGNVSSVKGTDIEKQPVSNVLLGLEGRVPGLFITQSTGMANSGVSVRAQGHNSITKGNDPLYIIDGVPYSSQLLPSYISILGSSGVDGDQYGNSISGNPLSFISPSDIESIEVLKDADATAIYGSRAANGAILITTKKGKIGQTKIDIEVQSGIGKITRKLKLLDTKQYLQMRYEAFKNDGIDIASLTPDQNNCDLTNWDTTRYTDWQNELIGGTANFTTIQTTVSGGSLNTQYLIGASFNKQTSVFPGNLADKKGSLHFNITNLSPNQKFKIQLNGTYLIDDNRLIDQDLTTLAIQLPPNAPAIYNTNGELNWEPLSDGTSSWKNPFSLLLNKYDTRTNNLISSANISYQILKNLEIKCNLGYSHFQSNEISTIPLLYFIPEDRPLSSRQAVFVNNNNSMWIVEPQIEYRKKFNFGKVSAIVGGTINQNNSSSEQIAGLGQNSDLVLKDIKAAPTIIVLSTLASKYNYNAVFGRINYNLQDKYIFNVTARRDGSSRFGSANLLHNFGSIGLAWIFSEEKCIKENFKYFSFGKIRGSYGTTGNDQIGDYQFMNLYTAIGIGNPYQGSTGIQPIGLPNPYLQWEETKKFQMGLDIGFFNDNVLFTANYFINRSSNQLLPYSLPIVTGFNRITTNFPAKVRNSGIELSLNTTNINIHNFKWTSFINLTIPKNKLEKFPNIEVSSYANRLIIGQPITILKVYNFIGVDATNGIYQFQDKNGNVTSAPVSSVDNTIIINTSPKYYGGFENSFQYKGISFGFLFQFVKQIGLIPFYGYDPRPGAFYGLSNNGNQPSSVMNRWQKAGDNSLIQRFSIDYPADLNTAFSSVIASNAVFSDASYVRLKNVYLSWNLPKAWNSKLHLQQARIFLQGQNLLTITNYEGTDPETKSFTSLPPLKILVGGIHITL